MGLDLDAPDHTTLSRRSQHLDIKLRPAQTSGSIHLIVDSTGLSIVGEGEWAAAKHGGKGRRGWKKLHLGVDRSGVIVAQILTDGNADDAVTGLGLIDDVGGDIASFTADAAYDTIAIYDAATARGAKVVVPPTRTAAVSRRRPRSAARDRTIKKVKKIGRRRWKKESGYHGQSRVENAFFRYKTIIGHRLHARIASAQKAEALIACNILNRMTELGRSASCAIES
jgi:IS5 family transposase